MPKRLSVPSAVQTAAGSEAVGVKRGLGLRVLWARTLNKRIALQHSVAVAMTYCSKSKIQISMDAEPLLGRHWDSENPKPGDYC